MKIRKFLTLKNFRVPFHPNLKRLVILFGQIKGKSFHKLKEMEHLTINGFGVYLSLLGFLMLALRWIVWFGGKEIDLAAPIFASIFYFINTVLAWMSFKKEFLLSFFLWGSTILLEILLIIFARM